MGPAASAQIKFPSFLSFYFAIAIVGGSELALAITEIYDWQYFIARFLPSEKAFALSIYVRSCAAYQMLPARVESRKVRFLGLYEGFTLLRDVFRCRPTTVTSSSELPAPFTSRKVTPR